MDRDSNLTTAVVRFCIDIPGQIDILGVDDVGARQVLFLAG